MNKRLQELAEQAKELAEQAFREDNAKRFTMMEKFAELIVRECDRYVAEQYDESEPWMQPGDLLKHFGVEQ